MGDDTAREIEVRLKLEHGWMDTPQSIEEQSGQESLLSKAIEILKCMEPEAQYQAVRLLQAIAEPPTSPNSPAT